MGLYHVVIYRCNQLAEHLVCTTVLQEGYVQSRAPGVDPAYTVIHDIQTDMIQERNAGLVDSPDNSKDVAKKALQIEEKDAHKGNVQAREAIADDEAKKGASVVSKMVTEIGNSVVEKSKTFARTVAERELKNEPSSNPDTNESETGDKVRPSPFLLIPAICLLDGTLPDKTRQTEGNGCNNSCGCSNSERE